MLHVVCLKILQQILRIKPDVILLMILETVKFKRMPERFGNYRCNSSCERISKHKVLISMTFEGYL